MKNNKSLIITICLTIIILALIGRATAIGISPGRTTVNFEPSMNKVVSYTIVNTEKKAMTVVMYARGELKDYIKLSVQSTTFAEGEETKSFTYTINLPENIGTPGLHQAEIVAVEVPQESAIKTENGQQIIVVDSPTLGTRLAVISQLNVYVLNPGKYLTAGLDIITQEDETVKFLVPLTSQGKLGIGQATATIDIYTSLNEKVATLTTNTQAIESQERKELYTEWDWKKANMNAGKYRAVATITYDGQTAYSDKNFEVGNKNLEIESININNFKLGEIAKFNILVNNQWAAPLKDVSVQIQVYNEKGEVMADFASQSYQVPALSKAEVVSYWDTVGVNAGTYKGKLVIKYEDKIVEKPIEITVNTNSIEVVGFTGKAIFPSGNKLSLQNILIGIVILLVIINAIWLFMFLRKKNKNKQEN